MLSSSRKILKKTSDQKGRWAEKIAVWLLRLKGFKILEKRYRNTYGEIDIIAMRRDLIVFAEVKYRPTIQSGLEAIQPHQRQRIERAAQLYLSSHKTKSNRCRFDAIIITHNFFSPTHIPDAWRLGE